MSRFPAILALLALAFLVSCSPGRDLLSEIGRGEYANVHAGKYPLKGRMLYSPSEYDRQIEAHRMRIEKDAQLMNFLCGQLFPKEKDTSDLVEFEYRGASINEEEGDLVLWYMGPIVRPRINAGYRAQWILDYRANRLTRVYMTVVPLE